VPVGAEENLTVGNGWRRVTRLAEVIHGQKFELFRIGPKNGGDASSVRDIQPPRGANGRMGGCFTRTKSVRSVRGKFVRLAGEELHEFGIDEERLAANGLFCEQSDAREFFEIHWGGLPPGNAAPGECRGVSGGGQNGSCVSLGKARRRRLRL
jgi:hypothetical protein